jgi:hypothetical protein
VRGALADLIDDGTITDLKLDHSPSGGSGEFKCAKDVDIAAKLKVAAEDNTHMADFEIKS